MIILTKRASATGRRATGTMKRKCDKIFTLHSNFCPMSYKYTDFFNTCNVKCHKIKKIVYTMMCIMIHIKTSPYVDQKRNETKPFKIQSCQ